MLAAGRAFCNCEGDKCMAWQWLGQVPRARVQLATQYKALTEAEAGGVGLWARYLVTGVRPSPDDAGVVSSDLYHLDAPNRAFARAVVESSLLPLELGAVPPHSVARAVLAWLREHAPEAIVAEEHRARATEVPS
jgi:hypothetical protein